MHTRLTLRNSTAANSSSIGAARCRAIFTLIFKFRSKNIFVNNIPSESFSHWHQMSPEVIKIVRVCGGWRFLTLSMWRRIGVIRRDCEELGAKKRVYGQTTSGGTVDSGDAWCGRGTGQRQGSRGAQGAGGWWRHTHGQTRATRVKMSCETSRRELHRDECPKRGVFWDLELSKVTVDVQNLI